MRKDISVHNSIQEYLTQTETKGLLYDRSFVVDAQKKRELQKKAQVIFEAFLQTCDYADESVRTAGMGEMLRASLIEVICAMKRKSGEEYRVVNDYLAFLQDRWKVETAPLDRQLTPLERQLSIAKELHDFGQAKEFDRHKAAEKYLVSDRTIENDMAALHEGIAVMDQRLVLDDFRLKNRRVAAISTMHPLFLTQNLTQVICMLEGLRRMEEDWRMHSYARTTAVSIWLQLSDYARDRILHTLVDLMGLERAWYERIGAAAQRRSNSAVHEGSAGRTGQMFYNEVQASDRNGLLMYAFKGGLRVSVSYITPEENRGEICGRVSRLDKEGIEVVPEGDGASIGGASGVGAPSGTVEESPSMDAGGAPVRIDRDRILEVEVATELR